MPTAKYDELEVYPPTLLQDGSNEEVLCKYDEDALSGYVDFANVVIYFDYEGYFIPDADYVASVEEVQHIIFKSLGEKSGLLEKPKPKSSSSTTLQVTDVSCMGLLGDFNVTKRVPGLRKPHKEHRYTKAKLKTDVFMLGLSSLPLDYVEPLDEQEIDTNYEGECKIKVPGKEQQKLPENGICRTVHAAVTAYIATTGNGTIVDPSLLEISTAKFLKNEIKKGKFVTSSIPYMAFAGIRLPTENMGLSEVIIPQGNRFDNTNSANTNSTNNNNSQSEQKKVMTQMGINFVVLFGVAVLCTLLVLARRMKQTKSREHEPDDKSDVPSDSYSPICSAANQKGISTSIRVQNYDITSQTKLDSEDNCVSYISNDEKRHDNCKEKESFETISNNQSLSSEDIFREEDAISDTLSVASEKIEVTASEKLCCFVY